MTSIPSIIILLWCDAFILSIGISRISFFEDWFFFSSSGIRDLYDVDGGEKDSGSDS